MHLYFYEVPYLEYTFDEWISYSEKLSLSHFSINTLLDARRLPSRTGSRQFLKKAGNWYVVFVNTTE